MDLKQRALKELAKRELLKRHKDSHGNIYITKQVALKKGEYLCDKDL